jgi:exodeoxyribonuclease V gamma subunit
VRKPPGDSRNCDWQLGFERWNEEYMKRDGAQRELFLEDIEESVRTLLELWAHPATHPAWYFPRAAAAIGIQQKDDQAEGAWQAERGYAPGYARLLGRGLDFEEGTAHFERLKLQAEDLMRLITPAGEEAE